MMNFKLLSTLFIIGITCLTKGCAQISTCQISIDLDECGRSHLFNKAPDDVTLKLSSEKVAKITLNDCMGSMRFKLYTNNVLIVEGTYLNATDTSIVNVITSDIVTGTDKTTSEKIFKPRKDGSWFYYNEKGTLLREDIYEEGALIKSKKKK